jgi:branched-chain amino acid transport system ATP-binding protein
MILEVEGVCKDFGKISALVNVDLTVEEGEIFGIAGPNGAGKSTLFNVIAGVYRLTAGKIFFDGNDITSLSSHKVCHLGLARTFQIPITFKTMSVYDNIRVGATFGRGNGKGRREKIESAMELLDLNTYRKTIASNLDLYTTKLVMMAAGLATGCKLLMLDEPLAGLTMIEMNEFLLVARKVNQESGITILMIEHLLDSLIEISDRMLILHNGEVIYTGSPDGVRKDTKVIEVYLGDGE